uniref:asparagine synthase-related protein n=1 Tax=Candidatus Electrothrix sp. TaxID=2170559 RepID=UPI0040569DB0
MKDQLKADLSIVDSMLNVFSPVTPISRYSFKRFSIGAFNDVRNGSPNPDPAIIRENGFIWSWNARFDNLKEPQNIAENSHERESIFSYIIEAPALLQGDFAVVAYNQNEDTLILLRDQLGTRPLYYLETEKYLAFATEMKALLSLPGFVPEMDEVWIADAISILQSEKWRTPYKGIKRMLPGHILRFKETLEIKEYWDLNIQTEYTEINYSQAVNLYKEKFEQSVCERLVNNEPNATELSGGLDSSGVTAQAKKCVKEKRSNLYAFTHAFSEQSLGNYFPFKDERKYSIAVCQHIGLKNHILCDADHFGLIDEMKKNIFTQSGPTKQSYSLFSDTLYGRGKDFGVSTILSGFGGDEGVTSKAGGFFEELIKRNDWDLYKREYFARLRLQGRDHILNRSKYFVKRYLPYSEFIIQKFNNRSDWRAEKYPYFAFSDDFEERMNIRARFFKRLRLPDDPDVRARQYKKIKHDHISQRFEYSYLNAKAYGIEY